MGAGTRGADRLAEQQNEGPFLVLFDVGGGEFMSPTIAETLEDVQAHVEAAEKASDGDVTVRSIKLSKVLATSDMVDALKDCLSDMRWAESVDPGTNFQASIIKTERALRLAGEKV